MMAPTKVAQAGSHEAGLPSRDLSKAALPPELHRSPAGRAWCRSQGCAEALLISRTSIPIERPAPLCFKLGKELEPPRPRQLCSSCRGQTPILCLGPWGCGLNTTETFFSFMNALSGPGLPFPGRKRHKARKGAAACATSATRRCGGYCPPLGGARGLANR